MIEYGCDNSLSGYARTIKTRPSMHPYSRHKTQAGPIRHYIDEMGVRGRVWLGMRKYGFVAIALVDVDEAMTRVGKTKPPLWWRFDPEYRRIVKAFATYRRRRYERDILNAITTAWRC